MHCSWKSPWSWYENRYFFNHSIDSAISEKIYIFAKSGCDVTGHIDLKPLNFKTVLAFDLIAVNLFKFILLGSSENFLMNFILIVDLTNTANDLVSTLSHGDKRKLEISLALSMNPKLLLFDEPMAGLDKTSSQLMIDLFKKLKVKAPILLIEHDMESVFALADRISVLDYGSLIASGNEKEIKSNAKVQEVYLGDENWIYFLGLIN